ncbi:MAG: glycosyltransferase [Phycisphaerae bacterium]
MRILLVSCAVAPLHQGGVARVVSQLGRGLAAGGHRVAVFTAVHDGRRPNGDIVQRTIDGVRVTAVSLPATGFLERYQASDYLNAAVHEPFRRCVESFAPEVVHVHAVQGLGAGLVDFAPEAATTLLTMHDYWWVCPNIFLLHIDETPCRLTGFKLSDCERCLHNLPRIRGENRFGIDRLEHRRQFLLRQLGKFDRVLAVSNQLRSRLKGFLTDIDIDVCENGISLGARGGSVGVSKNQNGSADHGRPVRFGFLGGFNRLKGFNCLAQAVKRLPQRDFCVEVYGCRTTLRKRIGDRLPGVRAAYRRLLGRRVPPGLRRFESHVRLKPAFGEADRDRVLRSFDALLVPSIVQESFSLVCREALAVGTPVIASRCGGPEEIVRHEDNGLLFELGSAADLAACMRRCVDDAELLPRLAANADADGIRSIEDFVAHNLQIYHAARRSS